MKSLHTIQRALVLGLSMAGWGSTYAANMDDQAGGADSFALAGRMSTSLSLRQMQSELQARPPAGGVPSTRPGETRFDIAVRNAPAAQVFAQIGSGSNYNMLVPPDLSGAISLTLRNTTMHEALDTLREMYGYDYRITGNRVFISSNTVQTRLYRINYLPGRRVGSSELSISSAAQANASGANAGSGSTTGTSTTPGASGSGGNSLTSSVRTTSDADFWKDVSDSLTSMIGSKDGRSVTMNPGAGVILVRATPAELRQVTEYLRAVQVTIERQVMLEAKIVEVQLSKGSETGINWGAFRSQGIDGHAGLINMAPGTTLTSTLLSNSNVSVTPGTGVSSSAAGKGFYGLAIQTPNFAALLSFLETQGNVQVLSSPRIAALNNQKAVLKVGSDDTFVTSVTNNVTTSGNGNTVNSPTVGTKTYFSGISLDVTPQIDDTGTVMLHVHPAISVATTKNLSLTLGDAGTYQVPGVAISINETDSMVRVRDGQIVAIGGLMQQSGSNSTAGLPVLSDAPVVGNLFRYKSSSNVKRELVILIKPTVITDDNPGASPVVPATPLLDQETASN
ncbi:MAG: pilus (MSHA type) biogenesis protein MshL [Aquabacterium sp.]|uniref:pilus (MSHA type) biogenesis protein MshL n=1 Tax=Aquabacterium sp. TaxID=1872578 RepID=UPI0025BCA9FD|nr:pilus (MSHA type) biogenesis protein MshL [Aquabacterium sp.]MBI3382506.1 pilus (MSHA type) biogenesis protein MshL [Aquabacterium sp.]